MDFPLEFLGSEIDISPQEIEGIHLNNYPSIFTFFFILWHQLFTPRKINMEHIHGGLEDHFPF